MPLDPAALLPLDKSADPPVCVVLEPAISFKSAPTPDPEAPTLKEIAPPAPAADSPVCSEIAPAGPLTLLPVRNKIFPLAPVAPAFLLSMLM